MHAVADVDDKNNILSTKYSWQFTGAILTSVAVDSAIKDAGMPVETLSESIILKRVPVVRHYFFQPPEHARRYCSIFLHDCYLDGSSSYSY